MSLWKSLRRLYIRMRVNQLRREGLRVPEDCRFHEMPEFGSEPYLISIGRHCAFAGSITFITHDGGTYVFREQERYKDVIKYGRITIHDNCVIGHGVIILPGVTIGPNCVVGAGSVVTRSIPPDVLAAGNPAKPVMTVKQYAEWSLASTPAYDVEEYLRDKKSVLLKLPLKGSPAPAATAARDAAGTTAPGTPAPPAAPASDDRPASDAAAAGQGRPPLRER